MEASLSALVAGGHLQVREVAVTVGAAYPGQLADFGHGLVLWHLPGLRCLGFGAGLVRQSSKPPALAPRARAAIPAAQWETLRIPDLILKTGCGKIGWKSYLIIHQLFTQKDALGTTLALAGPNERTMLLWFQKTFLVDYQPFCPQRTGPAMRRLSLLSC